MARNATPPTTPPTIAPVWDFLCSTVLSEPLPPVWEDVALEDVDVLATSSVLLAHSCTDLSSPVTQRWRECEGYGGVQNIEHGHLGSRALARGLGTFPRGAIDRSVY